MLPLLAATATFLSITFAFVALMKRGPGIPAMRIEAYKAALRSEAYPTEQTFGQRIFLPAAKGFSRAILSLLPPGWVKRLNTALVAAGEPLTAQEFLLLEILSTGLAALFSAVFLKNGTIPMLGSYSFLPFLVFGVLAPLLWLRRKVKRRRLEIWRSLADASDLITICVEAGMGIDAAFARLAEEMPGALSTEIHMMLRQVALGRSRRDALNDIALRTGVDDLSTFINAIVQAEQTGVSLGPVLRAQAHHIRVQRRLMAEEMARVAPAKMIFPIVFLIVPTLFIVILGPLVLDIGYIFFRHL